MTNRNRSHQICLRLSDDEYTLLQSKCDSSGLSKTDFLIKAIKKTTINIYRFDDTLKPMIQELRHIGANINQLAYFSNIGQEYPIRREIESIRKSHNLLMEQISEFLSAPKLKVS